MTPTKTTGKYSTFEGAAADTNTTQKANTLSKSEALYFDIANSVHGLGIQKGIINSNGNSSLEGENNIELCMWTTPPFKKKEDCEPIKCPPRPIID